MKNITRKTIAIFMLIFIMTIGIAHATSESLPTGAVNWAGYIAASNVNSPQNGAVTMVNGSWIVQKVNQGTDPYGYSSQWVGIDGATNQYLIQTGTESDSSNNINGASYGAWWEILPQPATFIPNFKVKPGDKINAKITLEPGTTDQWNVYIKDLTQGETFNTILTYNTPESSAEWIDERPFVGGFPSLADFHVASYGAGSKKQYADCATISGTSAKLNSLPNVSITMYTLAGTGTKLAIPSPLSSKGSFNVSIPLLNVTITAPLSALDQGNKLTLSTQGPYGGTGPYTYQWFEEQSGSTQFSKIKGATSTAYVFSTDSGTATGTWNFELKATDSAGTKVTSPQLSVSVNNPPIFNIQTNTNASSITQGQSFTLTSGLPSNGTAPYTYTWYEKVPGASSFTKINTPQTILTFYNTSPSKYYSYYSPYREPCVNATSYIYCPIAPMYDFYSSTGSMYGKLSSGNITNWNFTNSYTENIDSDACVQDYSNVYCVGGINWATSGGGILNSTIYAPLTKNGIGTWTDTTQYPSNVYGESCVESGNYIYCTGGVNNTAQNIESSYYAKLSTGGIGSWIKTSSYPFPVSEGSCTASNGYIYCVGGGSTIRPYYPMSSYTYYATLTSSGIGQWKQTTSYPTPIQDQSCNSDGNYIYCNAGINTNSAENASYYAPVSASGIGTWAASGAYPIPAIYNSCVISHGYMYCEEACNVQSVVNGSTSFSYTCVNTQSVTTFAEKLLPASYNFQSNSSTKTGTYQFELQAADSGGSIPINSIPVSVTINTAPKNGIISESNSTMGAVNETNSTAPALPTNSTITPALPTNSTITQVSDTNATTNSTVVAISNSTTITVPPTNSS